MFRQGEPFYIDLDARRYDLRLYDITCFIAHGSKQINDDYLELVRSQDLFDEIEKMMALVPDH